jgi:hypothetical protein
MIVMNTMRCLGGNSLTEDSLTYRFKRFFRRHYCGPFRFNDGTWIVHAWPVSFGGSKKERVALQIWCGSHSIIFPLSRYLEALRAKA